MAQIQFTNELLAGNMLTSVFGTISSTAGGLIGQANQQNSIQIYRGVPPTASTFATWANDSSGLLGRNSDLLLSIPLSQNASINITNNVATVSMSGITARTANISGTATWFVIYAIIQSSTTMGPAVMGNVSDPTGNGDLIIPDTNIVAGRPYKMQTFSFAFPYQITF